MPSLVGSEMCIRDSCRVVLVFSLLVLDGVCCVVVVGCPCWLLVEDWLCTPGLLVRFSRSGGPIKRANGSFVSFMLDVLSLLDVVGFPNRLMFREKSATKNFFMACGNLFKSPLYLKRFTFFTWMESVSRFSTCALYDFVYIPPVLIA